jgi:hypothetical protein
MPTGGRWLGRARNESPPDPGRADGIDRAPALAVEWDAVFLPQLEEGTLPIRLAESDEARAEERRLLYVGPTRARGDLQLSRAERRAARRRPSRFLAALEGSSRRPRPRQHSPRRPDGPHSAPCLRRRLAAQDRPP